jgi:hypothetical protein
LLGDIGLSILLKMELIALPGNAWHDGFSSGLKSLSQCVVPVSPHKWYLMLLKKT